MAGESRLIHTADAACVIAGSTIVHWNPAAEALLGYSARETVGRDCFEVFDGRDAAGRPLCSDGCHVMRLVRRGEPVPRFDMAARTRSGDPAALDVSTLVLSGTGAKVPTTVHLFRPVAPRRDGRGQAADRLAAPLPRPANVNGGGDPEGALSCRELEILRLLADGHDTKAIAGRLRISPTTVRNHVQRLLGKLGVHSRLQAVAHAAQHGLLQIIREGALPPLGGPPTVAG